MYVVVLPDGTKSEVPEWMTDAEAEGGAELVASPRVSVSALQALRRLVDAKTQGKESGLGPVVAPPPESGELP